MQIVANINRIFMRLAPSLNVVAIDSATQRGAFYQQIASGVLSQAVCNKRQIDADRLVEMGIRAYDQRQSELVDLVSKLLANLPYGKKYSLIARYFEGLYSYRCKNYIASSTIFEELLPVVQGKLKARISIALAAVMHDSKLENSLPYYLRAGTIAAKEWCDPTTVLQAGMATAIHKSLDGDHQGAVKYLEGLFPISKAISKADPLPFLSYLNSLAYENLEIGRLEEARRICRMVLASPFAPAYPEWSETRAELSDRGRRASRSVVAVAGRLLDSGQEVQNVVRPDFRPSERINHNTPSDGPAHITGIDEWKRALMTIKEKKKEKDEVTRDEKRKVIMERLIDDDLNDDELDTMYQSAKKKDSENATK